MGLSENDLKSHLVYCDGACTGNPGPGGWGAIWVQPTGEVLELGAGDPDTTNNRMEMMAAIRALESIALTQGDTIVFTDSTYLIRGITQWVWGWRQRDWKTAEGKAVANQDLWERLIVVTARRRPHGQIDWRYVRGHTGVPGNERVDAIAVAFTKGQWIELYRGPLVGYTVPVYDLPDDQSLPEARPKEAKKVAYSYLSVVEGVLARHKTWAECERRVKGRSGARFKKALSAEDETSILAAWGVKGP